MHPPKYIYHGTARVNRGSIRRHGLLARQPYHHPKANYRAFSTLNTQPVGVYGMDDLDAGKVWATRNHKVWAKAPPRYEEPRDVWRICTHGMRVLRDLEVTGGWVIPRDVPPECLTLVLTF